MSKRIIQMNYFYVHLNYYFMNLIFMAAALGPLACHSYYNISLVN